MTQETIERNCRNCDKLYQAKVLTYQRGPKEIKRAYEYCSAKCYCAYYKRVTGK